jgi:hypothetical protein
MKHVYLSTAMAAVMLTACGGGGGDAVVVAPPTAPNSEVPLSATTSSGGALTYVNGLTTTRDETASPVVVGDVTLGASETEEPDPGV